MNKVLKAVLLITILVVPVLIFIFLKIFGVNEYDLPVYYENGVDTTFTDCSFSNGQHFIPDFSFPDYNRREIARDQLRDAFLIVHFTQRIDDVVTDRVNAGLARVQGTLDFMEDIRILTILSQNAGLPADRLKAMAADYNAGEKTWFIGYANPVYTNRLARCGFIVDFDAMSNRTNNVIVLVDKKGRIRGYFNGLEDDEIDRLVVELKILDRNQG